ncbi:hypothetical protein [Roseimicrobium sp. ORNL1]|uniref:hypothetical protein n=1 Tax=Roseimicrobium sp. ORNL1 TaxID=2711231 RepID=UPI0013E20251|nr:hypothetical protein [Roseimicrobium sp. ORNL1]QIF03634.1 hypothetical protein G5S37_19605 [Roseimicrobium sp. ORNL1]
MKVFRLELTHLGTVHVEADSCTHGEESVCFYRAGRLLAEYVASTVKSVEATGAQPQEGLYSMLSWMENPLSVPTPGLFSNAYAHERS